LFRFAASSAAIASSLLFAVAISSAADIAVKVPPVVPPTAAPAWFVEGDLGGGWGFSNFLNFLNPVAVAGGVAGGLLSPTSGNNIVLSNKSLTSSSFTGGGSVGYFLTKEIFADASYQYFGRFKANGFALFAPPFGNVRQDLTTTAQAFLVGLGGDFNLTPVIFYEPTAQIGVGILHSTGLQGANIGLNNPFPTQNMTNFIAGAGLGVGYHVTSAFDVLVSSNYYYLGKANTDVTGNPTPAGMNTGEQLQGRLTELTAGVTGRLKF
jgi:hypothetical protein